MSSFIAGDVRRPVQDHVRLPRVNQLGQALPHIFNANLLITKAKLQGKVNWVCTGPSELFQHENELSCTASHFGFSSVPLDFFQGVGFKSAASSSPYIYFIFIISFIQPYQIYEKYEFTSRLAANL